MGTHVEVIRVPIQSFAAPDTHVLLLPDVAAWKAKVDGAFVGRGLGGGGIGVGEAVGCSRKLPRLFRNEAFSLNSE